MTSLVDFLTARIDEDEKIAKAALEYEHPHEERGRQMCSGERCTHDLRHDPARVLRECAAKRRLVNYWDLEDEEENPNTSGLMTNGLDADSIMQADSQFVLRVLASAYADHPDYRKEWA